MKVKDAIIAVLPHGVVEGVRGRRMLARQGAATTRRGWAARAREARLDLLPPGALREIETVVDVGAHEGRWSSAVLSLARPRHLIAVEPSPQVLPTLHEALRGFPAVVVAAAIGNSIPRSAALIYLYAGLRSGASAEDVLARAEAEEAPFARSEELRAWIADGLAQLS